MNLEGSQGDGGESHAAAEHFGWKNWSSSHQETWTANFSCSLATTGKMFLNFSHYEWEEIISSSFDWVLG